MAAGLGRLGQARANDEALQVLELTAPITLLLRNAVGWAMGGEQRLSRRRWKSTQSPLNLTSGTVLMASGVWRDSR